MSGAGRRRRWALALIACSVWLAHAADAALPEALQRVKPAVVAIGTFERTRSPAFVFRGTGFAVGDGSRVVTNAHVLPPGIDSERRERLVIALPGAGDRTEIRGAETLRTDTEHDLAVLRIDGSRLPAVVLADDALLAEGIAVGLTGFPIGSALGLTPVTHRGIVAAVTPIGIPQANARRLDPRTIRSLADGPFVIYQLDATAYPGNSGSPLFETSEGKVVGIVNMVFVKGVKENAISSPSGITYAIPVRHLRPLLE